MKKIIIRTIGIISLILIASYYADVSLEILIEPVYITLLLGGTIAVTLAEDIKNKDKSEWCFVTSEKALWLSFILTFLFIFARTMQPFEAEHAREEILLCMRPILYGLCFRIILIGSKSKTEQTDIDKLDAIDAAKSSSEDIIEPDNKYTVKLNDKDIADSKNKDIIKPSNVRDWLLEKGLSKRECEVAILVLDNLSNQEIAEELFLTENTVKKHNANIYKKLGVKNREQFKYKIKQNILY